MIPDRDKFLRTVDDIFLKHPREAGEHYIEHLFYTIKVATYLLISAFCAVTHGLFPKFFRTTTSDRVIALAENMQNRRKPWVDNPS